MTTFRLALTRSARRMLAPTLLAVVVGCALALSGTSFDPDAAGLFGSRAEVYWLHLPALLLGAAAVFSTLEDWPGFGRERRDGRWIRPHLRTPCGGCVSYSAAALIATAAALVATAAPFGWILAAARAAPAARAQLSLQPTTTDSGATVRLPESAPPIDGLVLRPLLYRSLEAPIGAVRLRVLADGEALSDAPLEIVGSVERRRLQFEPRSVQTIEIVAESDHGAPVRLQFDPEHGVVAIAAQHRSFVANVILAMLTGLFPTALALGAACALRRWIATPVAMVVAGGVLLLTNVAGLTPQNDALRCAAEGRWLPNWFVDSQLRWREPGRGGHGAPAGTALSATLFASLLLVLSVSIAAFGGRRR